MPKITDPTNLESCPVCFAAVPTEVAHLHDQWHNRVIDRASDAGAKKATDSEIQRKRNRAIGGV